MTLEIKKPKVGDTGWGMMVFHYKYKSYFVYDLCTVVETDKRKVSKVRLSNGDTVAPYGWKVYKEKYPCEYTGYTELKGGLEDYLKLESPAGTIDDVLFWATYKS